MDDDDQALIAQIWRECLAMTEDERQFCRLMRYPVRRLLDHDRALVQIQTRQRPLRTRVIGLDIHCRLARAIRMAALAVNGGAIVSKVYHEGPIVIAVDQLLAAPLGWRLRQLASGHLVISGYAEKEGTTQSLFAFMGIRRTDTRRLTQVLTSITPSLHRALYKATQSWKAGWLSLTPAEQEICRLLLKGLHNKQIAKVLCKSEATVRNQLHSTFRKLGVNTRTGVAERLRQVPAESFTVGADRRAPLIEHSYY